MLRANDIIPQSPAATSETSLGKGKHLKVEKEVEFGSESFDDEDDLREKALLVRFRLHVVNY